MKVPLATRPEIDYQDMELTRRRLEGPEPRQREVVVPAKVFNRFLQVCDAIVAQVIEDNEVEPPHFEAWSAMHVEPGMLHAMVRRWLKSDGYNQVVDALLHLNGEFNDEVFKFCQRLPEQCTRRRIRHRTAGHHCSGFQEP